MQNYYATIDVQDDTVIRVFEQYEDHAAMTAHAESDHAQEFLDALPELLAGEPEVLQFEVSDVTELEM
ncbi:antibiotic biosynthesis monooxygenase [Natrinema sp. 1APR25-10V2]|nr:antibiotic biosynthesis monooxygenase [Natrinema sp. 1APR25-10V2]